MKNYSLVIRRNVSYMQYSDVNVKASSLEEAKKIARRMAEEDECEFDEDLESALVEYEIEESEY